MLMNLFCVAFLPSPASFCNTFLKDIVSVLGLGTVTCLNNVVGVMQVMLPMQSFAQKRALLAASNFMVLIGFSLI